MGNDTTSQIEYFARAMKAPRIGEAAARLADQARDAGWSHEEYLAAVLSREVSAREASGAELRIRAAGFPGRKSLEEFTFDHQPGLKRDTIAHLGTGVFLTEAKNVVLLGPPGTGKTHLAIGLGIKAAQTGHRVLFATATEWVARLQAAHRADRLPAELERLRRYGLIIVDEVGYILPTRLVPIRTRVPNPHQQPALRPLGRRLRRPGRRRRDDRPHRSPRRRHHPERGVLPAEKHWHQHDQLDQHTGHGRIAKQKQWPTFPRAKPA
jgi:hypothetical protein